ncbi:MAG: cell filamentation protein Fic [Gemmatimonadetes bacterium]|nr:cell filamentation protein Fic [Gemmatimonadota bacterium]
MTRDATSILTLTVIQRKPVGYRADFLLSYDSGKSAYLSAQEREQLKKLGETPALAEAAGTFARDLAARLLIDLSWASSQLEGNTYSLLDTERLIQHGQAAQGKDASETQMILNHKRAIENLMEGAEEIAFNRFTLMSLHAALSENLLADPAHEGRLRTREVGITQSAYTPISIPQKIEEYFDIILVKLQAIANPFEQAFFAMVHLSYLQPFEAVNKRTSRLAANIPFIKGNLIPLSFLDVSRDAYVHGLLGVYEDNNVGLLKDIFVAAYERSSQKYHVVREAIGKPDPFRQKHRTAIYNAVRSVIMNELPATTDALVARALQAGIELPAEHRQFAAMVLAQLGLVTAENAGRYGLTPNQFQGWQT